MSTPRASSSSPPPSGASSSQQQSRGSSTAVQKRALSPASETSSSSKRRAPSVDEGPSLSDTEGSLGASRLNLDSSATPPPYSEYDSPAVSSRAVDDDTNDTDTDTDASYDIMAAPSQYNEATSLNYPVAPSGTRPDGQTQLEIVMEHKRSADFEMSSGDEFMLISRRWYRRWQSACSGGTIGPASKEDDVDLTMDEVGPIDNSDLVQEDGQTLKPALQLGQDVEIVPPTAWGMLVSWYGLQTPPLVRTVVSHGGYNSERVEFYPPVFKLFKLLPSTSAGPSNVTVPTLAEPPTVALPSDAPLGRLRDIASEKFGFTRPTRFWRLPESDPAPGAASSYSQHDLTGPAYIFAERIEAGGSELIDKNDVTDSTTLNDALLSDPLTRLAVEEQSGLGNWTIDETALEAMPTLAAVVPPTPTGTEDDKKHHHHRHHNLFGSSGSWFDRFHSKGSHSRSKSRDSAKSSKSATDSNVTPASSTSTGALTRQRAAALGENTRGRQRGLTGLMNLGNTCFMNSALQCMSNTQELQEYFTSGVYRDELNRDNPLGMQGQVAEAFGQLIERLWSQSGSSVAPREFKQALSRFAPQFSGYGQQDTQELLAFLLDGVHEDLNRIKKKPATSAPDWEGGGDKELVELAKTCWDQYRSRNDSVIVDLFQGQLRSTVVCPDCDKVSITFDPFMYVMLGLPTTKKWTGKVYFVPLDSAKPRYTLEIEVPKTGTIQTAKSVIAKLVGCEAKRLVVAEHWKNSFYKEWSDDDLISDVKSTQDELIFFETAAPYAQPRRFYRYKPLASTNLNNDPNAPILLPVFHKCSGNGRGGRGSFGASSGVLEDLFGTPFILSLTPEEASSTTGIHKALARQYARVSTLGSELVESVDSLEEDAALDAMVPATTSTAGALPATPPNEASMDVDHGIDDTPRAQPGAANENLSVEPPAFVPASLALAVDAAGAAASTSSSADASMSTQPTNAHKLFTVQVPRIRSATGVIPIEKDKVRGPIVPLTKRYPRGTNITDAAAPQMSTKTTVPGAFVTDDDDSSSSTDNETAATSEITTPARSEVAEGKSIEAKGPAPLVDTGDYIVVDWEPSALAHFFGGNGDGDKSTWAQVETLVDPALAEERNRPKNAPKKTLTIQDCLTEFTKEEQLGENDTWYCSTCKKHQQATKKVELWKVPDILVFAFKRFSSNRYSRDKIDDFIEFPLEGFDMSPYVEGARVEKRLAGTADVADDSESLVYDLYAVDNHFGGLGGGHYTAYAKNYENAKWYDFDDSRVTEVSDPSSVVTRAAYLVMYRRRTARPIGARSRELIDSAIQSRNASRAASEAGGPAPPLSRPITPFDSSEHLPSLTSSEATGTASFANTPDENLYGSTYTPDRYPGLESRHFGDGGGFVRGGSSADDDSENDAQAGSPARSHSPDLGFGAGDAAFPIDNVGSVSAPEDEVVDVKLDDVAADRV
ncbi:hypothetical protein OIO90_003095 [Microbotryomycetes sp. JL221]|nr:hypothetical protein OIO90_003095 [Microbotryomycetes sp. JL221]